MRDGQTDVEFLTVEVVIALHRRQLERFGGGDGVHDRDCRTTPSWTATMHVSEGHIDKAAVTAERERIAKAQASA